MFLQKCLCHILHAKSLTNIFGSNWAKPVEAIEKLLQEEKQKVFIYIHCILSRHNVSGHKSLILWHAIKRAQDAGVHMSASITQMCFCMHTWPLNQVQSSTYLLSLIKSIISCSIFKSIILSLSKRRKKQNTQGTVASTTNSHFRSKTEYANICKAIFQVWPAMLIKNEMCFALAHLKKIPLGSAASFLTQRQTETFLAFKHSQRASSHMGLYQCVAQNTALTAAASPGVFSPFLMEYDISS